MFVGGPAAALAVKATADTVKTGAESAINGEVINILK